MVMSYVFQEVMSGAENMPHMYPHLFEHLLTFTEYAVQPPKYGKLETKSLAASKSKTVSHNVGLSRYGDVIIFQCVTVCHYNSDDSVCQLELSTENIISSWCFFNSVF